MSTTDTNPVTTNADIPGPASQRAEAPRAARARGPWDTFAAIMLTVGAVANGLWGWAALRDAASWSQYRPIADAAFVGPLEFWGWAALGWTAPLVVGAVLLFGNHRSGRVVGIVLATLSAFFWLLVLPTFPLLAAVVLIIDVLIVYGLTVHGERAA